MELSDEELTARYRRIGSALDGEGDPDARAAELEALAAELVRRDPGASSFWYDRGMYAKWRRDWPASAEYNGAALDLIPGPDRKEEPAAWNLGIAATALRDWATARTAWAAYGIDLTAAEDAPPAGDGSIATDFGMSPVRLNASPRFVGEQPVELGVTEVVWGRRLCPARIVIANVPTPDSGHRCGDIVLHDGDPVGTRRWGERDYSVFNEIALWERSPLPTLTATLGLEGPEAFVELEASLDQHGFWVEDWTANLQVFCRACSEGSPDETAHHHLLDASEGARTMGISGDPDRVAPLLAGWAGAAPGRSVEDLRVALA